MFPDKWSCFQVKSDAFKLIVIFPSDVSNLTNGDYYPQNGINRNLYIFCLMITAYTIYNG